MVALLKGVPGVKKIILFGSLAGNEPEAADDIDLMVVMDTPVRFLDRLEQLYRVVKPTVSTDILAYTPDEFDQLLLYSSFVTQAVREGRILYEAK